MNVVNFVIKCILLGIFFQAVGCPIACAGSEALPQRPLIVRGDDNYPPYEFTDAGGNPAGFDIDILRAVAGVMGLDAEIRLGPWNEIRQQLERGEIDILTGVYHSEQRARLFTFSTPHIIVSHSVFVRKGSDIRNFADLRGKKIIVQKGDIMYDYLMGSRLSDNVYAVENQKEALRLLNSGQYDSALLSRLQGMYNAHRFGLKRVEAVGPPIQSRKYCFAVRKGRYDLITQLNEGLSILKTTGRYDQIYQKWFGVYERKTFLKKVMKYGLLISIPLMLVILMAVFWFRTLKHQVAVKTRALRKSEEKLLRIIDLVPHLICAWDREGRFILANRATASFFDMTAEALEGRSLTDIQSDFPGAASVFQGDMLLKARFGKEKICQDALENRRVLQVTRIPFQDGDDTALLMVGIDLTDLRRTQDEKESLERQLIRSKKMEALGILAGGVAHDLNNVLSGMVSYPDLLLMDLSADHPLRNPIITIRKSGQQAAEIVQDLLTLARRGVFKHEVFNLNTIVTDYLKSPEYESLRADFPGVTVRVLPDSELLNIKGSPVHLKKTVMNLVLNAAEAQPDGGEIIISTENRYADGADGDREGDFVVLTVADEGIGIDKADLDRIFEPFYTKKVMGRSGSGLGMAVVWGTIQDHNGFIEVDSVGGRGTVFTLFFPVIRDALLPEQGDIPLKKYIGKGESVLIIDDVAEQREIASGILRKLNYSVRAVSGSEAAFNYLKENRADLLILDMILNNDMDGLTIYRESLKINPTQKAVIASGYAENRRVKEAQKLGAGAYIRKPYTIENIGTAVRCELDRKRGF
ncbi:hypothetical protein DENIS_1847 [Desulfonema ishimotonii]|uniref:histidine kinase n=1 Tax=Desulfonema ishimotonii TaxID=45657 RepID=A0A401FV81_9BACT|nr:transporter substrate-binding domain-containing protein [Desulfonema ishimotonii]GBC60887.1 hypothetical protein DENIS_1847 [Desulfonema ishimotonii]